MESRFGTSELAVNANNIAGKKWNKGKFEPYIKRTNEYLDMTREEAEAQGFECIDEEEGLYAKPLPFNKYNSWAECIEHYCKNIVTSGYYKKAIDSLPDYEFFLHNLAKVYAPNHPTYAEDVKRVIIEFELTKFD